MRLKATPSWSKTAGAAAHAVVIGSVASVAAAGVTAHAAAIGSGVHATAVAGTTVRAVERVSGLRLQIA